MGKKETEPLEHWEGLGGRVLEREKLEKELIYNYVTIFCLITSWRTISFGVFYGDKRGIVQIPASFDTVSSELKRIAVTHVEGIVGWGGG